MKTILILVASLLIFGNAGVASAQGAPVDLGIITGSEKGTYYRFGLDLQKLSETGANFDGAFVDALRAMPQPTIAAVDGPAVTAGIELALACDIRLASPRARFADTHARVGVAPGVPISVWPTAWASSA